jgi:prolyl oligopeptidase
LRATVLIWLSIWATGLCGAEAPLAYPLAKSSSTVDFYFQSPVKDPYRWLEDGQSPEVKAWVRAEDRLARKYLSSLPGRDGLRARLQTLQDVDSYSIPKPARDRLFYTRRKPHQQKSILYWRDVEGKDHLLLDPMTLSTDGRQALGEWTPSPNGRTVAYQLKKNNSDEAVLHIRDVSSGEERLNEEIPGANFADVSWSPDGQGFYYMGLPTDPKMPESDRVANAVIRFHTLGTTASSDGVIYPKTGNSSLYLSPQISEDGHWLFVYVMNGWSSTDLYVRDERTRAAFQPLFLSTSSTVSVLEWQDAFYLYTNENAPHFKVIKAGFKPFDRKSWTPIIPERADTTITAVQLFGGHLVLTTLKKASVQLEIRDLNGRLLRVQPLPDVGKISEVSGREDQDEVFYDFETFTRPKQIFRTSIASGMTTLWAKTDVPINPEPYQVKQVKYRSKDGTPNSMYIVSRKNSAQDGSTPFFLQGYGGFSELELPQFNAMIYPWLEAGGGFALPNLRGGGEYGESWHQAGMKTHKQNTFDDFISAAEYLVKRGYTRKERLVIQGASNGGLLVGVAITQRPDLFHAAICKVPLLDMIRYPLFGEGPAWISEYGSPKNKEEFNALWAYSPYHHVRSNTAYPAVLFISAESDDRVDPMHARKMTASLQSATSSTAPILLSVQHQAGHGGADLKSVLVDEWTDRLSFLMKETGLHFKQPVH